MKSYAMPEVTPEKIEAMAQAIVDEVDPEKIILFGSHATGHARPDSDVDLLIIEREPFGPHRSRWEELQRIRQLLRPFRVSKDILVFDLDEVETWKDSVNHILATSLRDGKILYERTT
ncbi:MAG: nucleotidyltransferase domain-containing protein [Candidatus Hydrogenedentota bacterium]